MTYASTWHSPASVPSCKDDKTQLKIPTTATGSDLLPNSKQYPDVSKLAEAFFRRFGSMLEGLVFGFRV